MLLGAAINMDDTALYNAAAAIGVAGVPEADLVTMLIVFNTVGTPIEYRPLMLSVDRFFDHFRTATDAFGDSVDSANVDRTIPAPTAVAQMTGRRRVRADHDSVRMGSSRTARTRQRFTTVS